MFFEGRASCAVCFFRIVDSLNAVGTKVLERAWVMRVIYVIRGYLIARCFPVVICGSIARGNVRPSLGIYVKSVLIFVVRHFR